MQRSDRIFELAVQDIKNMPMLWSLLETLSRLPSLTFLVGQGFLANICAKRCAISNHFIAGWFGLRLVSSSMNVVALNASSLAASQHWNIARKTQHELWLQCNFGEDCYSCQYRHHCRDFKKSHPVTKCNSKWNSNHTMDKQVWLFRLPELFSARFQLFPLLFNWQFISESLLYQVGLTNDLLKTPWPLRI